MDDFVRPPSRGTVFSLPLAGGLEVSPGGPALIPDTQNLVFLKFHTGSVDADSRKYLFFKFQIGSSIFKLVSNQFQTRL